jgi:serine/threonine-protein kinase
MSDDPNAKGPAPGGAEDPEDDEHDDFLREVAFVEDVSPPARQPLVGQAIGRFRILSELGRGGMGIVYLAHDESLRRSVALKLLPPSLTRQEERYRRFLREARTAASVTHPNLATIYDVGEVEGNVFIAMERVEGKTLRSVLAGGRLSIEQAGSFAAQILAGLSKAHRAGIVHRDLKPDNVMVTDEQVIKLLDFGLAKQHKPVAEDAADGADGARDTAADQLLGTPGYMSPEQVRGLPLDARSDIFSFGVIFYEMLAGRRPFRGKSNADLQSAILRDTPTPLGPLRDDAPLPLVHLVERCLEKDPARRFPDCAAISAALAQMELAGSGRFITPSSSTLRDAAASAPPSRFPPAHQRRAVAALVSVGLIAAGVLLARQKLTAPDPLGEQVAAIEREVDSELREDLAELQADLAEIELQTSSGRERGSHERERSSHERERGSRGRHRRAQPTAVTDLPLPRSQSSEAVTAYAAAMQGIRDGNWGYVTSHLERAIELDPGMAIAHLRYAIIQHEMMRQSRKSYARAVLGRTQLNERDQVLLNAFEPLLGRDPPDQKELVARLRAATERYPEDAEFFSFLALWEREPEEILSAAQRAVELDPQYADGWQMVGASLFRLGRTEEALRALDRCIEVAPSAADCRAERGSLHGSEGNCQEMDEDLRRAVAGSNSGVWQNDRAIALFALGRAPEAVLEVYRTKWAQLPEGDRKVAELWDRGNLAIALGDFREAEAVTRAAERLIESDAEAGVHARFALQLALIYLETNRVKEAGKVADDYLRRMDGWIGSVESDAAQMSMYWTLLRAKLISPAQFAEKRDAWLRDDQPGSRNLPRRSVFTSYAVWVEEKAEAEQALELFGDIVPRPVLSRQDFSTGVFGLLYALSGSAGRALPYLEKTVHSCWALWSPVAHMRVTYVYGQALEETGDTSGACEAYSSILAHWGKAKPESVTANKSRARMRAIRCPSNTKAKSG